MRKNVSLSAFLVCTDRLGLETRQIPDDAITESSAYWASPGFNARLHAEESTVSSDRPGRTGARRAALRGTSGYRYITMFHALFRPSFFYPESITPSSSCPKSYPYPWITDCREGIVST